VTAALAGLTVVVTRPRRQAGPFLDAVAAAGGTAIALPSIDIEPVRLGAAERERCTPDAHDWTIYTSANAVEASFGQLPPPVHCRVAAVGRATARALESHGIVVHALPAGRADSEGLLALPVFADLKGRRVLIVRGTGGREFLREQLQSRGASVHVAEVYRREAATPDPAALAAIESALSRDASRAVVAVTSVEVLDGLLDTLPDALGERVRACALLVPGARVAHAASERRWVGPILESPTAEDAVMLATLSTWAAQPGRPAAP
jgi:uroporphyrinogen-III synthase